MPSTETNPEDAAIAEEFGIETGQESESEENENLEEQEEIEFDQLPASWQKEIKRLRTEAAAKRTATKKVTPSKKPAATGTEVDAVQVARDEARQEARMEFGEQLAAARIEAALAGLVDDPAELVEDLNLRKYVTDEGDVDIEGVAALKSRYEKLAGKRQTRRVGHGKQGDPNASKASPADQFAEVMKDLL